MKKHIAKFITLAMLLAMVAPLLISCANDTLSPREIAQNIWQPEFADDIFTEPSDVTGLTTYWNREVRTSAPGTIREVDDVKFMLSNGEQSRFVNMSDGYAITLPTDNFETNLQWSGVRVQLANESRVITITREDQNPYGRSAGGTPEGWDLYYSDWITRWVRNDRFLRANRLDRIRPMRSQDETILEGYAISSFDIHIRNSENIEMPYYNIAIIRPIGEYIRFLMIVQRSTHDVTEEFDAMIQSLSEFEPQGTSTSDESPLPVQIPDYWDDATRAYFNRLLDQDYIDWGFFTDSLYCNRVREYQNIRTSMERNQRNLQYAFNHTFTVMPTYTHIGFHGTTHNFPATAALEFAGGDGFNGRPVLHLSYQFTICNNSSLYGYTPMFQIMNGYYDELFREIAQGIRKYGYPVLFRLNNEMDTDWVSYAAIVTLLDPDIFSATWERMYDIFIEEGVTNAIWIFNPNTPSIPFSNWGYWLSYLPRLDTMHILGITAYEMGNNINFRSFEQYYRGIYERKSAWFGDWPWSISEFAAGSGGESMFNFDTGQRQLTESMRHAWEQADWIEDMFRIMNNRHLDENAWVRPIRIAIWFNRNDYVDHQGHGRMIMNHLNIGDHTPMAMEQFLRGLAPLNRPWEGAPGGGDGGRRR